MTPRPSSEELRIRAVIAGRLAAHESMDSEENLNTIASRVVAAAEPFIRELVVAEVVEAVRDTDTYDGHIIAEMIEREFGGSR